MPLVVNLNVTRNGDVSGTISQTGTPLQVVAVNSKIYFKVTQAFLRETRHADGSAPWSAGSGSNFTPRQARQLTGDLNMSSC